MTARTKLPFDNFLLCDFFRNQHRERKPSNEALSNSYIKNLLKKRPSLHKVKVFLCGQEYGAESFHKHFDKRIQIKKFLNNNMGCDAFLGEDIEAIKKPPSVNANALTIEVQEAISSDLIFLFLESFGTTSELTAFVLDEKIVDKLIVFNDIRHQSSMRPSFLTIGPLELLKSRNPRNVLYYDPQNIRNGLSREVIEQVDGSISRVWFKKCKEGGRIDEKWDYERFVLLALTYAFYPLEKQLLEDLTRYRMSSDALKQALGSLKTDKYVSERKRSFYEPTKPLETTGIDKDFQADISSSRSKLLHTRLKDVDVESNYRLIL